MPLTTLHVRTQQLPETYRRGICAGREHARALLVLERLALRDVQLPLDAPPDRRRVLAHGGRELLRHLAAEAESACGNPSKG